MTQASQNSPSLISGSDYYVESPDGESGSSDEWQGPQKKEHYRSPDGTPRRSVIMEDGRVRYSERAIEDAISSPSTGDAVYELSGEPTESHREARSKGENVDNTPSSQRLPARSTAPDTKEGQASSSSSEPQNGCPHTARCISPRGTVHEVSYITFQRDVYDSTNY